MCLGPTEGLSIPLVLITWTTEDLYILLEHGASITCNPEEIASSKSSALAFTKISPPGKEIFLFPLCKLLDFSSAF
jgi:hypothetical protein